MTNTNTTTDPRFDTLESMISSFERLVRSVESDQLGLPTPCEDFDVAGILDHVAVWIQVFDAAVNDAELTIDPINDHVTEGWADVIAHHGASIVDGLRAKGIDREMVMTASPMPGEFILAMLLMEYVGHGWDLARALDVDSPHSDAEAEVALDAAKAIIQPQYRGTGMFDAEVEVDPSADPHTRFAAFLGRSVTASGVS